MAEYEYTENNILELNEENADYNQERDFTTLEAWKKARDVKLFFYIKIIPLLPEIEKYNLNIQIRKAGVSSTANISEGYGRYHYQEGIQFYRISRGSLYELKDHLLSCYDYKYIDETMFREGNHLIEIAKKTLNGYINYVKKQIENNRR